MTQIAHMWMNTVGALESIYSYDNFPVLLLRAAFPFCFQEAQLTEFAYRPEWSPFGMATLLHHYCVIEPESSDLPLYQVIEMAVSCEHFSLMSLLLELSVENMLRGCCSRTLPRCCDIRIDLQSSLPLLSPNLSLLMSARIRLSMRPSQNGRWPTITASSDALLTNSSEFLRRSYSLLLISSRLVSSRLLSHLGM